MTQDGHDDADLRPSPDLDEAPPPLPGSWTAIPAPAGLRCWALDDGEPGVNVVLDPGEPVEALDVDHATSVLADVAGLLSTAERAVADAVATEPERFGADDPSVDAGLDHPSITLWTERRWMVHFAQSTLPSGHEMGVGVTFEGMTVSSVDPLDDSDPIA